MLLYAELEAWNAWTECSEPCLGQSYRSRVRRSVLETWNAWTECSEPCLGQSYRSRVRRSELETWNAWTECSEPCLGQSYRSRVRRSELETWNAWTECSEPCLGQSYRSRVRRCIYPNDPYGELPPVGSCSGSMYDQQNCDLTSEWDLWSSWSYCPCNAIPNLTKRARWRGCIDSDHLGILYVDDFNCGAGATTQSKLCLQEDIPASYYQWSSWGEWTPCPDLCLHDPTVITSRYRVCTYLYNGQVAHQLLCGIDFYQSEACPKVPCNGTYVPEEFGRTYYSYLVF
ncbi:A disintegrin and metalloproteinase with thrombospondin motifs adt-1-like [Branchiostoma lanceolatum]|uniref:A disintegrin and metalloproteinase with thrombospondin motifs adt-1-like n=1 Tax=Branchiostoma lanceolatum TaxID=7740 RepID=UPI00345410EA